MEGVFLICLRKNDIFLYINNLWNNLLRYKNRDIKNLNRLTPAFVIYSSNIIFVLQPEEDSYA